MKKLLFLLFLSFTTAAYCQEINGTVTDSASGQPLMYATIYFKLKTYVQYTGEKGNFSFNKDSVPAQDTIIVGYVGYKDYTIVLKNITDNFSIRMQPSAKQLQPVIVSTCSRYRTITANKPGRIDEFRGPGPETRIIIISRFTNSNNIHGYVKNISLYAGSFNEEVKVPVRLHWYKWNEILQQPGEEITDRNLIVYPYKKGWNEFEMPENLLWYSNNGIVLGLEFIYPVDFIKQYSSITSAKEKIQWLQNMQHRWSLGMKPTIERDANTFYIINNSTMQFYKKAGANLYMQPAIKFNVQVCKKG